MGGEEGGSWGTATDTVSPPMVSPLNLQREEHWRHFDNSVNAVSFGFVATAILISMFLVMAIFERFLRPRSSTTSAASTRTPTDLEANVVFHSKLDYPSPKVLSFSLSFLLFVYIFLLKQTP